MILIVGGQGLAGSAIAAELGKRGIAHEIVQRENRREFHGRACDTIVFCAGNSLRWKAAEDPHLDFTTSVTPVSYYLHELRTRRFVLLSDVEVYPEASSPEATREEALCPSDARSTYAYHKLLAEECVQRFAPSHLILRLPTLVGPGLHGNLVHDLERGSRPVRECPQTRISILHTERMASQLAQLLEQDAGGIMNLAALDNISLKDAARILGTEPCFQPDPGATPRSQVLAVDRASSLVELESSAQALTRYRDQQRASRTA